MQYCVLFAVPTPEYESMKAPIRQLSSRECVLADLLTDPFDHEQACILQFFCFFSRHEYSVKYNEYQNQGNTCSGLVLCSSELAAPYCHPDLASNVPSVIFLLFLIKQVGRRALRDTGTLSDLPAAAMVTQLSRTIQAGTVFFVSSCLPMAVLLGCYSSYFFGMRCLLWMYSPEMSRDGKKPLM